MHHFSAFQLRSSVKSVNRGGGENSRARKIMLFSIDPDETSSMMMQFYSYLKY